MELNEQEAHCLARILQGILFADNQWLEGCQFCPYRFDDSQVCVKPLREFPKIAEALPDMEENAGFMTMPINLRRRLSDETGVDIDFLSGGGLPGCKFEPDRFLREANPTIVERYQRHFNFLVRLGILKPPNAQGECDKAE